MSWQAYVDTSLVGTGSIDKAAIFNDQGNSCWARSSNFVVSPEEMKNIIGLYSDAGKAFGEGFKVEGEKYMTIKADERSLYGRKDKTGIIIVKTKQAFLVGHHPDTVASNTAANVVEQLADYLIGVGY